ncbi:IS1 family transposase [uncultured Hymenobacter sp.]|uniref:IS1 family transposase n=1 Tax=uncultured Hymenobacter sp. TaxID=170016 RepID=UPI0035CC28BE
MRPKKGLRKRWPALELDEMWMYAGTKKRKVWLWLAVERASRRIAAWVPGDCGPHCGGATGGTAGILSTCGKAYVGVLPRWQYRRSPKGGGTSIVEALNCALRQHCGMLVRKSCSFSKNRLMHTARIKIMIKKL